MSAHQCPDCPLLFGMKTELEFHLREEHPAFRHDYPEPRPSATHSGQNTHAPTRPAATARTTSG